ncbi:MAG: M28 family peptidase [Acidobacteriaceae bacterium]|nr:M28 family peptidase [Acidobacteriaceae bacterium]
MRIRLLGASCLALAATIIIGQTRQVATRTGSGVLPPPTRSILNTITAANLKGDLSFLSSDALQGRYTPSPGLDVAAEFIASQFRAAGLEPGGDQDYFQTAHMIDRQMPKASSEMIAQDGSQSFTIAPQSIVVFNANEAAQIQRCPVLVFKAKDPDLLKGVDLSGKAIVAPEAFSRPVPAEQREEVFRKSYAFDDAVSAGHAKIEILIGRPRWGSRSRLISADQVQGNNTPVVVADNDQLKKWLDHPNTTPDDRTVSFDVPAPQDHKVVLKNVIGILRGSDPKLKDTCVLLTAHYDHIGTSETGSGMSPQTAQSATDHIYNGANDDGSGTVSAIEIGRALAKLHPHPKRSIVFMTFFGEERGDIGSRYYGKHPVFPVEKTVADINLEQVGRTDSTEGKQLNNASVTGFDYSDVTTFLQNAGRQLGITVYLNKEASDAYFVRSDNAALAEQGVPAHTLCVAFDYPDYHGLGDEWQKIDYENMARVDRAVALAALNMANSVKAPQWNAKNPKTAAFRAAQAKLLGKGQS